MSGERGLTGDVRWVTDLRVVHAQVSTAGQVLTVQRGGLAAPRVDAVDLRRPCLTGTDRARPGLLESIAASSTGDTRRDQARPGLPIGTRPRDPRPDLQAAVHRAFADRRIRGRPLRTRLPVVHTYAFRPRSASGLRGWPGACGFRPWSAYGPPSLFLRAGIRPRSVFPALAGIALEPGYFVVARRERTPLLAPPQHTGGRSPSLALNSGAAAPGSAGPGPGSAWCGPLRTGSRGRGRRTRSAPRRPSPAWPPRASGRDR